MSMKDRPRSVTLASVLLAVVGVGYLVDAVAFLLGLDRYVEHVRSTVDSMNVGSTVADEMAWIASNTVSVLGALTAVAGLVLLGLAASVRAGQAAGRILTWVAAGLALACSVGGLSGTGLPDFTSLGYVSAGGHDPSGTLHRFAERIPNGYPPAYRYLSGGFGFLAMLALIAVIVLLAQSSANRYFRAPTVVRSPGYQPPGFTAPRPEPDAEVRAELSAVDRQWQRGELTDDEYQKARRRLLGG
jgi:hypothetical protein